MRLMLYNIRYGAGIGTRFHLPLPYSGYLKRTNGHFEKITHFIKSVNPDICALVEVDGGSFRSDRRNQALAIASEIQHYYVSQSKYSIDSLAQRVPVLNKQCNAMLTNQEIKNQRFHYFRKGMKRLVIELELRHLTVFLVHLSLKFRHRQEQLRDLFSMLQAVSKPVIVAGDFNVLWGDNELDLFLAATGLKNADHEGRPSHPSTSPRRKLDFILHSPEIKATSFEMPQVKFSDHIPLICDFEIAHRICS